MSLLSQTARYLLLTALAIALVGSVGFYTLIHWKIRHEVDEILTAEVQQTERRLQSQPLSKASDWDDNPRIEPVLQPQPPHFSDIVLPDSLDANEPVQLRQLQQTVSTNGRTYLVTVRLPYYEFNELAREMSVGVIIGFLVLMVLSVVVGLGFSRRLWRPFYATIDQLGGFRLDSATDQPFPDSRVREFGLLSRSLRELTQKLRRQFSLQKQFTENASHELQTPLAVAAAELDFLMQSERLNADDHAHLQRATNALSRLSQLNRSLLLLTQVENDQFSADETLDFSALVAQHVDEYEPFFEHKNRVIERSIRPSVQLHINRQLAVVLVTNLLKNAVRHGSARHGGARHGDDRHGDDRHGDDRHGDDRHGDDRHGEAGGSIGISLTKNSLTIRNTGAPLPFSDSLLFNRFVKNPARPDSTGLGLALVKQICDRYGLPLTYAYNLEKEEHSFQIKLV